MLVTLAIMVAIRDSLNVMSATPFYGRIHSLVAATSLFQAALQCAIQPA